MKIISLQAENVKRLRLVSITPNGNLVQITGANGSGKSSLLDAAFWALAGKSEFDPRPVRDGAEEATIRLDLGDIIVRRKITAGGTTSLIVENPDGARYPSPQTVLDHLRAKFMDPVRFTRLSAREQGEVLRGLVKLEEDVDALDRTAAEAFERRTAVNRDTKALAERVVAAREKVPPTVAQRIDVDALYRALEEAGEHNAAIARERQRVVEVERQISAWRDAAVAMRKRADELRAQAAQAERDAEEYDQRVADLALDAQPTEMPAEIDVAELTAQLRDAQATNARADEVERAAQNLAALEQAKKESEAQAAELTKRIDEAKARKAAAIAAAKMPVEGLSFGPEGVIYNGFPLSQCSSAEQLRIATAIAMAASTKLRVLWIQDGSLLDENSLQLIAEMAVLEDYQVWVERVDTSGKVGIVMEDGAVVAIDGEPVAPAAEASA